MRPSAIASTIKDAIVANTPLMLWGPPGIGKSQIVAQVAESLDRQLIDMRLTYLDPVDLHGIPFVKGDQTHWATPSFLPKEGQGILFVDEINAVAQAKQAVAYQLILDRRLGEYKMPDSWFPIAAGNRMVDRAVVYKMPSALANRFVHIEFEVNFDDWVNWAFEHDIVPEVINFLRFRPGLLHDFNPDAHAFATPRSWEYASKLLGFLNDNNRFEVLKGTVGDGVASEFLGFLKVYQDLPNIDLIFLQPEKVRVPTDTATLYALVGAVSSRVDVDNFGNVMKYALKMPEEFQVLLVRDCTRRDNSLLETKSFKDWATKFAQIIL